MRNGATCRICHTDLFNVAADFGLQPLANSFGKNESAPLTLMCCSDCGLYQLKEVIDPNRLFSDYPYRSGVVGMQKKLFADFAKQCNVRDELVVDIGCNDGALLREFQALDNTVVGVDPYATPETKNLCVWTNPWDVGVAEQIKDGWGEASIITATNVWAHLDDVHAASEGVSALLKNGGSFVVQVPWVRNMLCNTLYDTIYHEHLSYFGVKELRRLFQPHWMDVYHVDYLPNVHGGSIRCWVGHGDDRVDATVKYAEILERDVPEWDLISLRIKRHQEVLRDCLDNDDWAVFGAAAKAVMLVSMVGLQERIVEVVDHTPAKQGKTFPGTDIVITGEITQPNVILGAWNFAEQLKAKLPEGTKVCIPFPIPRIEYV